MKTSKTILLALLMAACGTAATAQDTLRLSLDSCLRYAREHNLQVRTAMLESESAQAALAGSKLRFLPSISASASQGWAGNNPSTGSTQYGLNGSLTLFSGLANLRSLQQSRVAADQSALKVRQAENAVAAQVAQAYLTILMNEERLAYQQEVLETSRRQRDEGEAKFRVGRILESDYLLLQASYTSAEAEVDITRLTIQDNRATLLDLLGIPPLTPLAVEPSADTMGAAGRSLMPFDTLMAQARRSMPDWQISEMDVQSARHAVGIARSNFLPTLSLSAGLGGQRTELMRGSADAPFSHSGSVSLGLNIPILNRGTSYTQFKQSKIALQEAELRHQQTLIDLEDELEQAYLGAAQALGRYRAAEALSEAYHASYEVYVLKFEQGAVTAVEMLQQQDKYLSALNDYLQNKYSFLLTQKQLDIYTGREVKL